MLKTQVLVRFFPGAAGRGSTVLDYPLTRTNALAARANLVTARRAPVSTLLPAHARHAQRSRGEDLFDLVVDPRFFAPTRDRELRDEQARGLVEQVPLPERELFVGLEQREVTQHLSHLEG